MAYEDDTPSATAPQTDTSVGPAPDSAGTAVESGIRRANNDEVSEAEEDLVKALKDEYTAARQFDKSAREQYVKDRKYAAGTADPRWASDANCIGAFIDILVAFLYAQDPDISARPSEQVGDQPGLEPTQFAQTMELTLSRLWKKGALKRRARKQVRSALSVGVGWIKALLWSEKKPQPQIEHLIQDAEDQLAQIQSLKVQLAEGSIKDVEVNEARLQDMIAGYKSKLELATRFGFAFDFVRAEDIQISLDVSATDDYLDADWVSNDMYVPTKQLRGRFKRLTDDDMKGCTKYYQRHTNQTDKDYEIAEQMGEGVHEGQFSKESATAGQGGSGKEKVTFARVTELWDRRDGLIKTIIDGVKKWAVEPYPPPQASSRFFPYFRLAFFEVDGERHPQSLSWRLRKLQDEYANCRSNQRLTRERCVPGTLFNRGQIDDDDAKRMQDSVTQEFIGLNPTDNTQALSALFAAKPINVPPESLYDTTPILSDMERLSGVQEALQQASVGVQPKTATEAQIQQTGFASRTSADRDTLEEMLTELAQYCGELAIQSLKPEWVTRICGPKSFWPFGMDIQDLLTMVEVDITSGTTGKPNAITDKQNWATILPMLEKLIVQIRQVQQTDPGMAQAFKNLLAETLRRMDDRLDVDLFLPAGAPAPPPAPMAPNPLAAQPAPIPGPLPLGPAPPGVTPAAGAPQP